MHIRDKNIELPQYDQDHPVPTRPITWPLTRTNVSEIQQLKVAGQVARPSTAQKNSPSAVSPNTQGFPKGLVGLSITKGPQTPTSHSLRISFKVDPSDHNYQYSNIYLKQGTAQPLLVASGPTAPVTLSVAKTSKPTVVIVQPVGPKGAQPLAASLTRTVSLL